VKATGGRKSVLVEPDGRKKGRADRQIGILNAISDYIKPSVLCCRTLYQVPFLYVASFFFYVASSNEARLFWPNFLTKCLISNAVLCSYCVRCSCLILSHFRIYMYNSNGRSTQKEKAVVPH